MRRLKPVLDPQLADKQVGLRHCQCIADQVFKLTYDVEHRFEENNKSGFVLADLTAAHDCLLYDTKAKPSFKNRLEIRNALFSQNQQNKVQQICFIFDFDDWCRVCKLRLNPSFFVFVDKNSFIFVIANQNFTGSLEILNLSN